MPYPDLLSLEPHIRLFEGLAIDLDGTLMSGGKIYPDTAHFLASLNMPFMILSNDSEHTCEELAAMFVRQGLAVEPRQFILAGVALLEELAQSRPGARIMLLASPALRALASRLGLVLDNEQPELVVVMRDPGFDYARLAAAARAIHQGARLIVACPDTSHPGPAGEPVPEAGTLASAIRICTGTQQYQVFGKPEPAMFKLAAHRLGVPSSACAMIGDNPDTDGLGARRAGMAFHHVTRFRGEPLERAA